MQNKRSCSTQRGTTMIEVLVTIVILAIGLLGLAGLQSRLQVSEMEAYQRSQALLLLDDMANRLASNRNSAFAYTTAAPADAPLGAGMTCPTATSTRVQADAKEWCDALQGAAEITSGSAKVGALIGGRGCIQLDSSGQYMVTVAWQGLIPISAPPASVSCGQTLYNGTGCTGDLCRRVVTTLVRIAVL